MNEQQAVGLDPMFQEENRQPVMAIRHMHAVMPEPLNADIPGQDLWLDRCPGLLAVENARYRVKTSFRAAAWWPTG